MDRETRRLVEEYRLLRRAPSRTTSSTSSSAASSTGRSSSSARRCSASALGTIGAAPRYAGEADVAFGRAHLAAQGRRHDPRRPAGPALARAVPAERRRHARARRHPGRVPDLHEPAGQGRPMLATSWKPNADATVWTFQLRKGVKFHNGKAMTSADVVASMKQYVGEKIERGPLPVLRRRRRLGGGPVHGRLPAEVPDRRVPVPAEPDDVPGDHPAGGDRRKPGSGSRAA